MTWKSKILRLSSVPLSAARCPQSPRVLAGGQAGRQAGLDVDGGERQGGAAGCVLKPSSVFRRAAEQLKKNFSAATRGGGWESVSPATGSWIVRGARLQEDWSGSLEPFPANMDDLGKFARPERTV